MTPVYDNNLSLAATQFSPGVEWTWQTGRLVMIGESYPENTYEFFAQIVQWTENFIS